MGFLGTDGGDVLARLKKLKENLGVAEGILTAKITGDLMKAKTIILDPNERKLLETNLSNLIGNANALKENCRHVFFK